MQNWGNIIFSHKRGIVLIYLAITILGIISLWLIPIEEMPNSDFPQINVSTNWWGASPELMEKNVTSQLEDVLSKIKGVISIKSYTWNSYSNINLVFEKNFDMNFAYMRVNEAIYQAASQVLPKEADYPQIEKYIPEELEQNDFFKFAIYSKNLNINKLSQLVEEKIKSRIEGISGVSGVDLYGLGRNRIQITVDFNKLKRYNLNLYRDIISNIRKLNYTPCLSEIKAKNQKFILFYENNLKNINELNSLVIKDKNGEKLFLSDVAKLEVLDVGNENNIFRINGEYSIQATVYKVPTANSLKVIKSLKREIKELQEEYKENCEFRILSDSSEEIIKKLKSFLYRSLFTILIIIVVLYLFLSRVGPSFYIVSSIFLDILITINFLYFSGNSLNFITLSGLGLAFGMLVDNSIVVYDSIKKKITQGLDISKAITNGINEVIWSILASTLTTIIVFIPFIYLQKDIQIILIPFGFTVGLSLINSVIVSITFIPILMNEVYKNEENKISINKTNNRKDLMIYGRIIEFLLNHRSIPILFTIIMLCYASWVFIEKVDKGYSFSFVYPPYIAVNIRMPFNSRIETINEILEKFEKETLKSNAVNYFYVNFNKNSGRMRIYFKNEFKETIYPLILREQLISLSKYYDIAQISIWGLGPPIGSGYSGMNYQIFSIKGYDYDELNKICEAVGEIVKKERDVYEVLTNSYYGEVEKQVNIKLNQNKMAFYGVSINEISNELQTLGMNGIISNIKVNSEKYEVKLRTAKDFNLKDLYNKEIKTSTNKIIRFSNIADIKIENVAIMIERENKEYIKQISVDYRGNWDDFNKIVDNLRKNLQLPPGYSIQKDDNRYSYYDDLLKNKKEVIFILFMALLFIYMVTAGLFESLILPFIVMLTIPLAFIGIALIYWIFDVTFTTSAFIGSILVSGIVVNNSIILLERTMQIWKNSEFNPKYRKEAIILSAKERVKPILMTSVTTILGLLPFILYTTEKNNEEIWTYLAYSNVGGLTIAMIFTVFLIPAYFEIVMRMKEIFISD